jgi:two-component system sensor histidine kinase SenX3
MKTISIRELHAKTGGWVRQAVHYGEIAVTDHGIGIPQDELDKVFEIFHRVRDRDGQRVWGTGLGLYVCHTIIEQHGGKIEVQSAAGQGAQFTVTLPVKGPERNGG